MTKTRSVLAMVVACSALLLAPVRQAAAQLSSVTDSTTGSSCAGSNNSDGFCGSAVSFSVPSNGATFTSRYAWNVNADTGLFGNQTRAGTAAHHVNFNATAVGGYLLSINTSRVGDMARVNDLALIGGNAQAAVSGVTGTSNIGLTSGSLNLADPSDLGNGNSTTSISINQSSSATICRNSNGVAQAHALTFTWNGSVRSNQQEIGIRMGLQNGSTTGCSACEYPGNPSRTQGNDGHFVQVSITSLCGNGVIDSCGGETCDEGSANGAFGSCCNANCTLKTAGTTCRDSDGVCDPAETCTGSSPTCPANQLEPNTTLCRASAGPCDLDDYCTGSNVDCPADAKSTALCRGAADVCDEDEFCDGVNNACPADMFMPSSVVCRGSAGDCDVAENCTGSGPSCPADAFKPSSTECRASAGFCDIAENCTGGSATCPTDMFKPSSVECRADTGQCDVAENCTGSAATCPADGFEPSGTPCDDGDNCTTDDACDGNNNCSLSIDVDTLCGTCEHCDPGDGMCVPGPRPDCLQPTQAAKARLLIKDNPTRDAADLVVWKWIKGEETTFADFGDPTTTTNYELCIFDAGTPVVQSLIPAGGTCGSLPCWRTLGSNGYKYINRDRTPDGILKVLLRAGSDGKAKIILKGKGENLPFEPAFLPMATPVIAQLHADQGAQATDTCWETNHISLGPLYNAEDQFKAVDEGPMP